MIREFPMLFSFSWRFIWGSARIWGPSISLLKQKTSTKIEIMKEKHCEKVSLIFSLGKPALVLNFSQNHWATKISWEMVKIDKMARWNTREYCHHLSKKQGGKAERSSIMVVTRPVSQSLLSYICFTTLEMKYPRKCSLALNVKNKVLFLSPIFAKCMHKMHNEMYFCTMFVECSVQ